jgi:hypothetical protein
MYATAILRGWGRRGEEEEEEASPPPAEPCHGPEWEKRPVRLEP